MRTLGRHVAVSMVVALCVAGVGAQQKSAPAQPAPAKVPKAPHFGAWGVDLSGMDRGVNPADDFDRYVNGTWFAKTEIPADQGSAGVGYAVFNLSQDQIRAVIENAPVTTQLGAMYRSFMNEAAVESIDDKPLQDDLKRVAAIQDKAAFTKFMGETSGGFGFSVFGPGVAPDPAKPEMNTLFMGQAGIGLPDRDYYLKDTFKPQRDAYRAYLERVLTMTHDPAPAKTADTVMVFETTVAKASWPAADRRDIDKVNNPMSVADLQTFAPGLDWNAFFA